MSVRYMDIIMEQEFDEFGRGYWFLADLDTEKAEGYTIEEEMKKIDHESRQPVSKAEANLISSLCSDGLHRPTIDLDIPARYIASTTPGHGHLYIDKGMTTENYWKLLRVLSEVGLVEEGFVQAAIRRGASFLRPPGVQKPVKDEAF